MSQMYNCRVTRADVWIVWKLLKFTVQIAYILLSITNKIQRYTIFFITVNALHVSGCFSAHHQELRNCTHTASGICQACLLLPVAPGKLDIYPMLCVCVQFLSSWWWAEKQPETCRALIVIKNIFTTLHLVGYTLKDTLTTHGPMNGESQLIALDYQGKLVCYHSYR